MCQADTVIKSVERCGRAAAVNRFGDCFDCYKAVVEIGVVNAYPSKIRNGLEDSWQRNWKSLELGHEAARFLFEETQTINRPNVYEHLIFKHGFWQQVGNPCPNRLHTAKSSIYQ